MSDNKPVTGLTDEQVLDSRSRYGSNLITPPAGVPLWKKFLQKFSDPLIIIPVSYTHLTLPTNSLV